MMDVYDRIKIVKDDLTKMAVDAIVNAANESLLGGGGVDGAIHRAAGAQLLAECKTIGGCPTGQARITRGYRLPAQYIIHTVGPIYHKSRDGAPSLLASCYQSCYQLADEYQIKQIAFPAISCGVYGYPIGEACEIALNETMAVLNKNTELQVWFVLFSKEFFDVYQAAACNRKEDN